MQTDERKNGGKGTCFEETVPAVRKRGWDLLIWGSVVLFTLLYLSLIFNNNVWTDEIFSVNLFRESFGQIIMDTAEDVHPPLYYFLGRIFRLLFGDSLQVQKILTIIPMSLTLVLGATKIRRFFGNGVSYLFLIFLGCIPCSMEYAVQIRMYSWALLCVTACALAAWEIYRDGRWSSWIMLSVSAVAAAYLHYFSFVSVIIINGLLFLVLLLTKENRKSWGNGFCFPC